MKKRRPIIVSIFALGLSYLLLSYNIAPESEHPIYSNNDVIEIPTDIQSILDGKCIKCHSSESSGSKSKSKLNFDKFTNGDYSNGKLVSKFGKISKQLKGNKMPPKKYLSKNPDKKLTSEESELILKWAGEQSNTLAGE